MNKKEFIKPDVQITLFNSCDVITTSPPTVKLPIDEFSLYSELEVDRELNNKNM